MCSGSQQSSLEAQWKSSAHELEHVQSRKNIQENQLLNDRISQVRREGSSTTTEILVSTEYVAIAIYYPNFMKKCNFVVAVCFSPTFPSNFWTNWLGWTRFERGVEILDIRFLQVLCAGWVGKVP